MYVCMYVCVRVFTSVRNVVRISQSFKSYMDAV